MSLLRVRRPAPSDGPPTNEVSTGPTVTGRELRALLFCVTLAFGTLTAIRLSPLVVGAVVVGLAFALIVTRWPRTPVPHVILGAGGLAMLAQSAAFDPIVFLLLPLGHVALRASWWAARVPARGGVERSVLLLDARRAAVVQAVCQALALVGLAASTLEPSGFFVVLAAAALVGLVAATVPRTWWR
ncbi:hypothetical protein [Oerskovia turbata]